MDVFITINFYINAIVFGFGVGRKHLPLCSDEIGSAKEIVGIVGATILLVASLAWDLAAEWAVRTECRYKAPSLAFFGLFLPGAAIWLAYRRARHCEDYPFIISLFGLLAVRTFFSIMFYMCYRKFGNGLKEKLAKNMGPEEISEYNLQTIAGGSVRDDLSVSGIDLKDDISVRKSSDNAAAYASIVVSSATQCTKCNGELAEGAKARWRRGEGVFHARCVGAVDDEEEGDVEAGRADAMSTATVSDSKEFRPTTDVSCAKCHETIAAGEAAYWERGQGCFHTTCPRD